MPGYARISVPVRSNIRLLDKMTSRHLADYRTLRNQVQPLSGSVNQEKPPQRPESRAQQADALYIREGLMRSPVYPAEDHNRESQVDLASPVMEIARLEETSSA